MKKGLIFSCIFSFLFFSVSWHSNQKLKYYYWVVFILKSWLDVANLITSIFYQKNVSMS